MTEQDVEHTPLDIMERMRDLIAVHIPHTSLPEAWSAAKAVYFFMENVRNASTVMPNKHEKALGVAREALEKLIVEAKRCQPWIDESYTEHEMYTPAGMALSPDGFAHAIRKSEQALSTIDEIVGKHEK